MILEPTTAPTPKLGEVPSADVPLPPAERLAALEYQLKQVTETSDKNTQVFLEIASATEARQWMIMRALDDQASLGRMEPLTTGTKAQSWETTDAGTGFAIRGVNWEHYKNEYLKFAAEQEKAENAPEQPVSEFPEDAVIFGGDHA
jgi:hypothetical protein